MHDNEFKLCAAIAAKARVLLEDLRLHVGLPTGGGNKTALNETRDRLTQRLRRLGASVEMVPGEAKPEWLYEAGGSRASGAGSVPPVAVCRKVPRKPVKKPVLIVGHLDTVHDPNGPFKALTVSADGKTATGPGCVDMKGGLVIGVAALETLDEMQIDCEWTVVFNSDEETGSYHSEKALRVEAKRCAERGGVGLVLEPALADGGLVTERLGSGQFMVEARGRAAHVGRDFEKGVSAVTALAERLVTIGKMADPVRGLIVNVGPLAGGVAANVVPDLARAWGNVRFPTKAVAEEIAAKLKGLQVGVTGASGTDNRSVDGPAPPAHSDSGDALPMVKVEVSLNRPAKPLTPGTQALAELARGVAEELGQKLPFGKTGGVCDGNTLQDEGLPTIDTLGVRGGGLHTPQEWIEIPSLVERCQMFAVVVKRISEGQ
jgi:glutamate carboxypeptidase